MLLNDKLCSVFQSVFFPVFFKSGCSAAAVCGRRGMYRVRWCFEPMKFLYCLNVLGKVSFSIVSVFIKSRLVPSLYMLYPSLSTCLHATFNLPKTGRTKFLGQTSFRFFGKIWQSIYFWQGAVKSSESTRWNVFRTECPIGQCYIWFSLLKICFFFLLLFFAFINFI